MRKAAVIFASIALVVGLSGCGDIAHTVKVRSVKTHDDRTVECVIYQAYKGGGIDCDWDHATKNDKEGENQ